MLLLVCEVICHIIKVPYSVKKESYEKVHGEFDKDLGWSFKPNIVDGDGLLYTDEHGIRIPNVNFKFDNLKPSILFLGCSFTFGSGLSFDESFVGQFANIPSINYQVVNLGIPAYGTDQSYLALKRHMKRFNTKIVIYTFIDEHIKRNGNYDRRMLFPDARFPGTKPLFKLDSQNNIFLAKSPKLYTEYYHSRFLDLLRKRIGMKLGVFPPSPEDLTLALILEQKNYCEKYNVKYYVINWNGILKESLSENKIDFIDVPMLAPPGFNELVGHPDSKASSVISSLIFKYLQEHKALNF